MNNVINTSVYNSPQTQQY